MIRQFATRYLNTSAGHPRKAHNVASLAIFYASVGDGKEGVNAVNEKRAPNINAKVNANMPPY